VIRSEIWDHLEELRRALLKGIGVIGLGFVFALIFAHPLMQLVEAPLRRSLSLDPTTSLVLLGPMDGATLALRLAFWISLTFTAPLWVFFLFQFAAPGLRGREKRLLLPFLSLSSLFISAGIALAYFVSLPCALRVLWALNAQFGQNFWVLSRYVDFALLFLLSHGIAFELFLALLMLVHWGVISAKTLSRRRRYVVVGVVLLSALLTPPDVITQLLLSLPLLLLFEVAVLWGKFRAPRFSGTAEFDLPQS